MKVQARGLSKLKIKHQHLPMTDQLNTNGELLKVSLSAAVPFWIEILRSRSSEELMAIAHEAGQIIAEKGDVILYGSKKKGETAKAFNALAKGIAACAFVPGGITILGLHFSASQEDPSK